VYGIKEGRSANITVGCIGQSSEERDGPSLPSATPDMTSGNTTRKKERDGTEDAQRPLPIRHTVKSRRGGPRPSRHRRKLKLEPAELKPFELFESERSHLEERHRRVCCLVVDSWTSKSWCGLWR
jgi:hypothetical protein